MPQLLRISPSGPALALVVSLLLSSGVRADNPHGTDAPDTPGTSTSGDDGSSSADNAAGASGSNGGLSKTAQIVIGVVVGVVCLAAIGFGVWFFLRKKRKWDEQTKRYETINAFRKSAGSRRQHEMSLRKTQRRHRRDRDRDRDLERGGNNLETSESQLPKYDPSNFDRKNEYSIDSTRGLSIDLARHSFMDNRYQHQRNSSQLSGVVPHPPPGPAPGGPGRGSTSMEMTSPLDMSRGASPTEGADHSNTDSPTPMLQGGSRGGIKGTFKGPKKPKPVLTRLITNL